MGNACGELPQRGELLRLDHLRVERVHLAARAPCELMGVGVVERLVVVGVAIGTGGIVLIVTLGAALAHVITGIV